MFPPILLIIFGLLLHFFLVSFFSFNFWAMTSSLAPDAVRYHCVCSQITYPLLCRILLVSKKCMSRFCHIFCLTIQVELVLLQSLSLTTWSFALLQTHIDVPCIILLNGELLFTEWCSSCSVVSLLRLYILHCRFCFCLFCATTDGFSFPTQQQVYPELEMDF